LASELRCLIGKKETSHLAPSLFTNAMEAFFAGADVFKGFKVMFF